MVNEFDVKKSFLKPPFHGNCVFVASILIALVLGYFLHTLFDATILKNSALTAGGAIRENDPEYKMIKPLLLCSEKTNLYQDTELHSELKQYIDNKISDGKASDVSVYFKDLNSGAWMGVNENDKYSPASLLKVAIMLGYLKIAENEPSILTKEALFDTKENLNQSEYFVSSTTLQYGKTYTFADLIERMIEHSDNNAMAVLESFEENSPFNEVYADLGLPPPPDETNAARVDYISARLYASFFRVLYNATYLSRDLSNKALELLSQTHFDEGLAGGIPKGVTVAHKFGERTLEQGGGIKFRELHDCGIVYKDGSPYIICVMTKGSGSFAELSDIIKSISKMAYEKAGIKNDAL